MRCCAVSLQKHGFLVSYSYFFIRHFPAAATWNSLPCGLRDQPLSFDSFRRHLKTILFSDH